MNGVPNVYEYKRFKESKNFPEHLEHSFSEQKEEINEAVETRWGDLHEDLLHQVFRLLPVEDLMCSVSFVCRHWRLVCRTVLFWNDYRTLDLSPLNMVLTWPFKLKHDLRMQQLLNFVLDSETMEHCVRTIIFSPCMHLNDKHLDDNHLAFAAKRSLKLKNLVLPDLCNITLKGFSEIMKTWRELEELSLGPLGHSYLNSFFPICSRSCENLTTLHIFGIFPCEATLPFSLDEKNALIITKSMRKLKVFTVDKVYLQKSGVLTLLSKSKNLVELNLKRCRKEPDENFDGEILDYEILEDEILEEVSMEIRSCRLKSCLKWYIASSSADHKIMYTAEELVNELLAN